MLVDESYFIGPLEIAQLGQKAVVDKVTDFINRFEPVIMEAALGYDFYQAFLTALKVNPVEQRWKDLNNGASFTSTQLIKKRWTGFSGDPLSDSPYSPIAGFIYYEFMKDMASQNTGTGYVKSKSENSESANPVRKPVNAFNESVRQIRVFWEMMQADQEKTVKVYPEFDPLQVPGYSANNSYGGYGRNLNGYSYAVGWYNEAYCFRTKNVFGI